MKKRILLWGCIAFLAASCHKDGHDMTTGGEGETAQVSLALRNDVRVHEVMLTRAAVCPEEGDFLVRLENTRAEVLKEWRYDTMPPVVRVVPGSYKLAAYYGDGDKLPAFDSPYYYGETKVTLRQGDNLDTVVNTSVATVKVALAFDESFDFDYDDYFVDVKTVGDSLRFVRDEEREGYFLPGNLRMRFGLKPKGQERYYEFYPEAIRNVKAAEFYRMTLKAQSENGILEKISIVTDSATIDIPVEVDLPSFLLPKAAPEVTLDADELEGESIPTTEGVSKKARIKVAAAAGLTELKIKTVSDTLLARGWPAELDLMKATEAQKEILKANGLTWSENIDGQDTVKSTVWLLFDDVVKSLSTAPGQTAVSTFEILAKDRFAQTGNDCRFAVKVAPPVFGFVNAPGEGNVWAKRALYDVKYVSQREKPVVECRGTDGNWKTLETTLTEKNTDEYECLAKGLTPATTYDFRVRLGEHTLDAGNYRTEEAAQVPNAGMEKWEEQPGKTSHYSIWSVQGWCTMNELTTSEGGTNDINVSPNRDGMAYCATSGTKRTTDCKSGTYAALVRSVGWGKGSSIGAGVAGMKKATAGELYLGSYNEGGALYGIEFAARPAQIKFYSKYSPYNSSDKFIAEVKIFDSEGVVIAEGSLSDSYTGATSEYVVQKIQLEYKNFSRRATKMYIRFVSGTCVGTNKTDFKCTSSVSKDFEYVGAQLYIDDIELIYE